MISHKLGYIGVAGAVVAMVAMLLYGPVLRAAAAISQGYLSEGDVGIGMLVSRSETKNTVQASTPDSAKSMVGVVSSQALLEISGGKQEVQVATNGTVETFVSTLNGDVKMGDRIAPSPIAGVGMSASGSGYAVGIAAADFDKATSVTERRVVDKEGNTNTVKVGLLPVQVSVNYYEKTQEKSILPEFINNLARTIAGREVSVVRVLAAGAVLAVGLSVVVVLVSTSARSSIISIGRNPLAAKAVHKGLLEASGLAIGILLVMLVAVYLVLVI